MSYDVGCWIGSVPVDADAAEEIWDDLARRSGAPPQALLDFVAAVRAAAPDDLSAFDREPPPPWAMSGTLEPEGWVVEVVMTFDGVERGEAVIRRAAAAHGITVWDPQSEHCWVEGGSAPSAEPSDDDGTPVAAGTVALWIGPRPTSSGAAREEFMRRQDGTVEASLDDEDALDRLIDVLRHARLLTEVRVPPTTGLGAYAVVVLHDDVDRDRLAAVLAEHGAAGLELGARGLL